MVGVEFWGPWVSKVQVHNLYGHFLDFNFGDLTLLDLNFGDLNFGLFWYTTLPPGFVFPLKKA